MKVSGTKFEEHCSNISGDILDWVLHCFSGTTYDVITFLICIIQNVYISKKKKKIFSKEKRQSSLLWKAFQISNYYFLLHKHFNLFRTEASQIVYPVLDSEAKNHTLSSGRSPYSPNKGALPRGATRNELALPAWEIAAYVRLSNVCVLKSTSCSECSPFVACWCEPA